MMFLNVFFSPGAAFRKLKEKPNWIAPLIVVLVVLIAVSAVGVSKMDYSAIKEKVADQMRQQGLSEEQVQQRMEASDKIMNNPVTKYALPLVTIAVSTIIGIVIMALILMLLVPLAGGSNANFLVGLGIVCYAALVRVIAAVIRLVLILLRGVEHAATSLILAVPNAKGFAANFLGRIDIFAIWEIILIAMGLKIVYGLKDNRSYYYLFGLWLVYNLLMSLLPSGVMRAG